VPVSGGDLRECRKFLEQSVKHTLTYLGFLRVTEVQAFLFELVSRLKFEPAERTARIRRENCLVMLPMVGGEEGKGNQLPLKISIVDHSDGE
jgi:hypothetical protein